MNRRDVIRRRVALGRSLTLKVPAVEKYRPRGYLRSLNLSLVVLEFYYQLARTGRRQPVTIQDRHCVNQGARSQLTPEVHPDAGHGHQRRGNRTIQEMVTVQVPSSRDNTVRHARNRSRGCHRRVVNNSPPRRPAQSEMKSKGSNV